MTPDQPPNGLTLWGIGTPRALRAHWMLAEFGLDYALQPMRSRSGETTTPEFLALNPKHKIPVLQHGGFTLTESAAIVGYIADAFPPPPGFVVPRTPAARARLNEWCFFIMTELDSLSLYVIRRHLDLAGLYGAAPEAVAYSKEHFAEQTGAVFAQFATDRPFLMDEGMTVADILMATCIDSALRRGIALPPFLVAYMDRMVRRPAWRAAYAKNYPERAAAAG